MFDQIRALSALPLTAARRLDRAVTAGSLSNALAAKRENEIRRALESTLSRRPRRSRSA